MRFGARRQVPRASRRGRRTGTVPTCGLRRRPRRRRGAAVVGRDVPGEARDRRMTSTPSTQASGSQPRCRRALPAARSRCAAGSRSGSSRGPGYPAASRPAPVPSRVPSRRAGARPSPAGGFGRAAGAPVESVVGARLRRVAPAMPRGPSVGRPGARRDDRGGADAQQLLRGVKTERREQPHARVPARTPRSPARSSATGTSSTPTTSCSAASPARPPRCCAASTSRSSRRTSTPATSSSSSTPRRSPSPAPSATSSRYRHSGYPGGLSKRTVGELLETKPERVVELAVRGMLPQEHPRPAQLKKLKVYAGPDHPHAAQKPQPFEIKQVAQ